jgi:broad specificity phosphatase PhoE
MPGPWRPYLDPIVARANAPEGSERGHVLVLRHSIRESITATDMEGGLATPLTPEGRALASAFGRRLDPGRPLRLFHSPVPRCRDTASRVAEAFAASGGVARIEGDRPSLGAPYLRDVHRSMELFTDQGIRGFVDPWARGTLDPAIAQPPAEAGRILLAELLDLRNGVRPETLDLHVTHDLSVMTLLAPFLDVSRPDLPWPDYLDGVVLHLHPERRLWHRWMRAPVAIP